MPSVSDLLLVEVGLDASAFLAGVEQASREGQRAKSNLKQQGDEIEHIAKGLGESILTALRGIAGLMGITLTFEGFKRMAVDVIDAGTSLGRFSEATGVASQRISELEQALARTGGRADDVRPILLKMRQDLSNLQATGKPPEWFRTLGSAPFLMSGLGRMSPDDILLEVARKAQAAHMNATQLQLWLPGLNLSPETAAILVTPGALERAMRQVREAGTAPTPENIAAAERLKEKTATLGQLTDAVLRDVVTASEPFLDSVIKWITEMLDWIDGILRKLTGAPQLAPAGTTVTVHPSRENVAPGPSSSLGGPRVSGGGSANYMKGPLPGPQELTTVETASGKITVNRQAASDIKNFIDDLVAAGAPREQVGSYASRLIAGTMTPSQHAYGTAIDYGQRARNVVDPAFRQWADTHQAELREILAKHNMISGGNWRNPDFGHFEWSPRSSTPVAVIPQAGGIDRSAFAAELAAKPWLVEKMASMVQGEVGKGAPIDTKLVQLESAFNRAQVRGTSLEQALLSVSDDSRRGYYAASTYRAVTADDVEKFKRDVLAPVLAGSDVGKGVTGNASAGVAARQFARGTPGYKLPAAGGTSESYFFEGPFRQPLPRTSVPSIKTDASSIQIPNVATGAAAAVQTPRVENKIINNEESTVVNHVMVNTYATDAAQIANDVRKQIGLQLATPEAQEAPH